MCLSKKEFSLILLSMRTMTFPVPCQPLSDHETSFKDSNFKRFSEDHAPDPLEARPSAPSDTS